MPFAVTDQMLAAVKAGGTANLALKVSSTSNLAGRRVVARGVHRAADRRVRLQPRRDARSPTLKPAAGRLGVDVTSFVRGIPAATNLVLRMRLEQLAPKDRLKTRVTVWMSEAKSIDDRPVLTVTGPAAAPAPTVRRPRRRPPPTTPTAPPTPDPTPAPTHRHAGRPPPAPPSARRPTRSPRARSSRRRPATTPPPAPKRRPCARWPAPSPSRRPAARSCCAPAATTSRSRSTSGSPSSRGRRKPRGSRARRRSPAGRRRAVAGTRTAGTSSSTRRPPTPAAPRTTPRRTGAS